MVGLAAADPTIVTDDGQPPTCPKCGHVDMPVVPPGKPAPKFSRFANILSRLKRPNELFRRHDAERTIAVVKVVAAVILSHSCDIDGKGYIRFAAVREISFLSPKMRDQLRKGELSNFSYFHLPPTSEMPEAIVDLDLQFSLQSDLLGRRDKFKSKAKGGVEERCLVPFVEVIDERIASLDREGIEKLYAASVLHLAHSNKTNVELSFTMSYAIFEDDPDRPQAADRPKRTWWWPRPLWLQKKAVEAKAAGAEGGA